MSLAVCPWMTILSPFLIFQAFCYYVRMHVTMVSFSFQPKNLVLHRSFILCPISKYQVPTSKSSSSHVIMCHRTDFHKEQWQYSGKSRVSLVCMHATQIVPRLFAHKPCELMIWCTATRLLCVNLTYTSLLLRLNWRNVEKWKSYEIWDREIFVRS